VEFPARFTLVAASNPCPCGFEGDQRRACRCRSDRLDLYRHKLSGPLLDRIDIRLRMPRLSKQELMGSDPGEPSVRVRERVVDARDRQHVRSPALGVRCNSHLPGPIARRHVRMTDNAERFLGDAVDRLALTGRGFDRALKVALTIADLSGVDRVDTQHIAEALSYRDGLDDDRGDLEHAG
jgi:magnesium chelatase family protein